MKVFIPAKKDLNPFFDEIMEHSKHQFVFGSFDDYKRSCKIVLIHWPEQLFGWKEPSLEQLNDLTQHITNWKKNAKIIYVVHNLEKHKGMNPVFRKLYDLIESNCDCMLHFGEFSQQLFLKKIPKKQHVVIYHPLYKNSFTTFSKEYARKKLSIQKKALVIVAPGAIRNKNERKLVLKAFKRIKKKGKVLIVPRMLPFELPFDFKGRIFLKKFIDVNALYSKLIKKLFYRKPTYMFNEKFLSEEELSLFMAAADIVLLPRIKILNSGNFFLGLTFQKIIVGPAVGNLTEMLELFKLPYFNPQNKDSIDGALQDAITLFEEGNFTYDENLMQQFEPSQIAQQWDQLFEAETH